MTATPTSGAADRAIEGCPELNMGNYDEVEVERLNDWAIRAHDEIDRLHALAAGQATAAQQGAAYAETPTSNYAGRVYEEGFLIGTCPLYTADQLRAFADATYALRASHGQAPAHTPADSVLEDAEIDRIVPALEPVSEDFPAEWAVWKDRERIREELRAARKQGGAT